MCQDSRGDSGAEEVKTRAEITEGGGSSINARTKRLRQVPTREISLRTREIRR